MFWCGKNLLFSDNSSTAMEKQMKANKGDKRSIEDVRQRQVHVVNVTTAPQNQSRKYPDKTNLMTGAAHQTGSRLFKRKKLPEGNT